MTGILFKVKKVYRQLFYRIRGTRLTRARRDANQYLCFGFKDAIGKTLYKVRSGGGGRSGEDRPSKDVLEILTERRQKWYSLYTESERQKHLWTQSDGFYASRKRLIECGYTNDEIDREYITELIKDICENKLDVKREDIGIISADRAQLYFKGKWKKTEN